MKCSNCGATITAEELREGACEYCGAAVNAAAGNSVGAEVDRVLAGLGLEGEGGSFEQSSVQVSTRTSFVVNGQTYTNADELPAEVREVLARVGQLPASGAAAPLTAERNEVRIAPPPSAAGPAARRSALTWILLVVGVLLLVGVVVAILLAR